MSIAYSANGATVTHPAGLTFTQGHDAQHNLTSQSDPAGGVSQYSYDAKGHPVGAVDRTGAKSSATFDAASGLPSNYTDAAGNTTSFTYTATVQAPFVFYDLTGVTFADGTTIGIARDAKEIRPRSPTRRARAAKRPGTSTRSSPRRPNHLAR